MRPVGSVRNTYSCIPQQIPLARLAGIYLSACRVLGVQGPANITIDIMLKEDSGEPQRIELTLTHSSNAIFSYDFTGLQGAMARKSRGGYLYNETMRELARTFPDAASAAARSEYETLPDLIQPLAVNEPQLSAASRDETLPSAHSCAVNLIRQQTERVLAANINGSCFLFGALHETLMNGVRLSGLSAEDRRFYLFFNPLACSFGIENRKHTLAMDILGQIMFYDHARCWIVIEDPDDMEGAQIRHRLHINDRDIIDVIECTDYLGNKIIYRQVLKKLTQV